MKKLLTVLFVGLLLSISIGFGEAESTPFSDEFDSSVLDIRWEVVDPYGGSIFDLTVTPGYLTISTSSPPERDLVGDVNFYAPRILQSGSGDMDIETKISAITDENVESAGIVVWKDENNFLRLERAQRFDYQEILFIGTVNGVWSIHHDPEFVDPGAILIIPNINPTYLRMVRIGNTYSGYYSEDGSVWNFVADITMTVTDPIEVGLYIVIRGPPSFAADFDYFRASVPPPPPPPPPGVPEFPLGSAMPLVILPLLFYLWWKRKQKIS